MIFFYLLSLFFPPDWITNIARCACLDVLCRWNSIKRANYSSLLIFAGLCNDDSPSYPQQPFLFAADAHVLCKFRLCGHKNLSQTHLFHSAASSTREIVYSSVNLLPACAQRTKLSSWKWNLSKLRPFCSNPYILQIVTSRHRWIQFPSRNSRHSVGSSLVKQQKAISKIIFARNRLIWVKLPLRIRKLEKISRKSLTWIIAECLLWTFSSTSLNISEIVLKLIKNENSRAIQSPVEWNFL